jgi:membrane protein
LAAALAYYSLFSLAPLLVLAIGVAGSIFGRDAARREVVAQFSTLIGRAGANAVEGLLASTASPGKSAVAATLGLLTLLIGASGVFAELQDATNTIWQVEPRPDAGWGTILRRRFVSFSMVLGSGFLLLVSLLLSAALAAAGRHFTFATPLGEAAWSTANSLIGLAMPFVIFALIFRLVPDAEVAWRDVWVGALVTAALFSLGRWAFGYYLGRSAIESTYGAAASLVAVVLWVYYSAQILFIGAELTQALGQQRTHRAQRPKPGAEKVVHVVRRPAAGPRKRRAARRAS